MLNPHCSIFRIITAIFLGVQMFRNFTVVKQHLLCTVKIKKIWTPQKCCNYPKTCTMCFNHSVMYPRDADGMADSIAADPDQTASSAAS